VSEEDNLQDPSVDARMVLKLIVEKWDDNMNWIDLAQDRDRWRCCEVGDELLVSIKCGKTFD
jgi:hypothetical protein